MLELSHTGSKQPAPAGDILYHLRETTQEIHERLHIHPLTAPLLSEHLTLPEYTRILEAFYGFYQPLEVQISLGKVPYCPASRTEWLIQDLTQLGYAEKDHKALPCCASLPEIASPMAYLGYCYVVEGSSLGSQRIYKHLHRHLDINAQMGARFFQAYGPKTGAQWKKFKAFLGQQHVTKEEKTEILSGALETFLCLEQWLWQCNGRYV